MDALVEAANGQGVRRLIDSYYEMGTVQGFALGAHGEYVSMFRGEYGRTKKTNEILRDGRVPNAWHDACLDAGFPITLSPIYVVIYVSTSPRAFRSEHKVPRRIAPNHLVMIEQIDPFEGRADRAKHRPLIGGTSVGSIAKAKHSGTLGGFVKDVNTGDKYILSCYHVLLSTHDRVVQQATGDGGTLTSDSVGETTYNTPLSLPTGWTAAAPYNDVDAALARVDNSVTVSHSIRILGPVNSIISLPGLGLGDKVVFVGKESDYQEADVYRFVSRAKVNIDSVTYNFGDLFEIIPRVKMYVGSLSKPGDSGAWIVRETSGGIDGLCGLLIAGSSKHKALCCYIDKIVNKLNAAAKSDFQLT